MNTAQRSLDTIPETQDLDVDLEVVLTHVGVSIGQLPYYNVDPNSTTSPMHSTPGIDSPVMETQTAGTEYISPVFRILPQIASGWDHTLTT